MKLMESSENYLETILMLKKKNGSVRAIDIANKLNYSKASVSVAMKNLKEKEYIKIDTDNNIILTKKGLNVANEIYEKHVVLTKMLVSFGVCEQTASEDACKMEHTLSEESFICIKNFVNKHEEDNAK